MEAYVEVGLCLLSAAAGVARLWVWMIHDCTSHRRGEMIFIHYDLKVTTDLMQCPSLSPPPLPAQSSSLTAPLVTSVMGRW